MAHTRAMSPGPPTCRRTDTNARGASGGNADAPLRVEDSFWCRGAGLEQPAFPEAPPRLPRFCYGVTNESGESRRGQSASIRRYENNRLSRVWRAGILPPYGICFRIFRPPLMVPGSGEASSDVILRVCRGCAGRKGHNRTHSVLLIVGFRYFYYRLSLQHVGNYYETFNLYDVTTSLIGAIRFYISLVTFSLV